LGCALWSATALLNAFGSACMLRLDFAHQPSATHVLCRLDGVLEGSSMYTAAHTAIAMWRI